MQLGLRKNTHSQYFFNLFCNSMQKNAPICGAFKEFHTVLQLKIPNYNFNVASILIWSSPIILLENEIMMQHVDVLYAVQQYLKKNSSQLAVKKTLLLIHHQNSL